MTALIYGRRQKKDYVRGTYILSIHKLMWGKVQRTTALAGVYMVVPFDVHLFGQQQ